MAKHAVLSASSSERWLNCPPSARLCEAYEDKGSDYAAEGTDAHTLCEARLRLMLGEAVWDPVEDLSWYNEEMEECAQGYAAYVVELLETAKQTCSDPVVMIEQRVDFSRWVNQGDHRYMALSKCADHGSFLVRLKLRKNELGLWSASRLIYRADDELERYYKEKASSTRRRRHRSRHSRNAKKN